MELSYQDSGHGLPVLLVHGFPLNRSIWAPRGDFRWVLPDLRGFGATAAAPTATMEEQAEDLLELLDAQGIHQAVVAGHSMGGYILFAIYRKAPDRVAGGVFVTSRASADTEESRRNRETTARRAGRTGPSFLADTLGPKLVAPGTDPALVERVKNIIRSAKPGGVTAALRGMAARPDSTPDLPKFAAPALVISGAHDPVIPSSEGEAMARAMPRGRFILFEKSGHLPMIEEPDRFWTVLNTFLKSIVA